MKITNDLHAEEIIIYKLEEIKVVETTIFSMGWQPVGKIRVDDFQYVGWESKLEFTILSID